MGWGGERLNERTRIGRRYVQVVLPSSVLDGGWRAFGEVARCCKREGVRVGQLVYLRHAVTPVGVTALFEVLSR